MATFWTRKGDQEDDDEKTAKPFAEFVSHGNINFPLSGDNKPQKSKGKGQDKGQK